ncbi:MAG: ECF-type sigma factor [Thermoanaerobaculia bacterium]
MPVAPGGRRREESSLQAIDHRIATVNPLDPSSDAATPGDITELLSAARRGDEAAASELFEAVYGELKRIAHGQLARLGRGGSPRGERGTIDTTALVHEAYFRLATPAGLHAEDRRHFFNLAARLMRNLLVDFARRRNAEKRGGELVAVALEDAGELAERRAELELSADVLALDAALATLEESAPELARLVELRFFAGLTLPEISGITLRSERSLKRDWRRARAFLLARMGGDGSAPDDGDTGDGEPTPR